jgi:hypothetical protein
MQKLGSIPETEFFEQAAKASAALKYLVQFMPGAKGMPQQLENTVKAVTVAKNDPKKYDPGEFDISQDANELWKAIEPIFAFHGSFKRFCIQYEDELKIPGVSAAYDTLNKTLDQLVYSALAIITEPAVKQAREAIKESKELIEKVDRQNETYINIFDDASEASDPSHSVCFVPKETKIVRTDIS